ncbi:hypothetical protein OPT61_g9781 [Boeremia exigua]|uniref:Uncharacterized protein n=1 Tax=Boeremia exigua TaxID=749465 RepID=A0ACC2HTK6_9PLEO|nr:hypothetical protein OPT61_g9781 [Boeremia exigua]
MRLLYESDGELRWTNDLIKDIPRYAILSHTWVDEQEVTFNDLKCLADVNGTTKTKAGWDKIEFCARQAQLDGLEYFWIDSCCIDKANFTELSEAINSMFLWYKNAEKCYVYLLDVACSTFDGDSESSWTPSFKRSRWFTRGWTLQELLAPQVVEFFSKDRVKLGDKETMMQIICEITAIPTSALSGKELSEFSVTERFSWAEGRETTKTEDSAYCLFGVFGLHLPLIYGEGKEGASRRLKDEIDQREKKSDSRARLGALCQWLSAPDPSTNYNKAHKQRQAKTGLWLLESEQYKNWKTSAASRLWLYGIPGCGKTILSSTIIENLLEISHDNPRVAAIYFFFDFRDTQKQDPELMLRSLFCQLLQQSDKIPKGVDASYASCRNGQQLPSLGVLLQALQHMIQGFTQVYIVLDALDECTQRTELLEMIETIAGWPFGSLHLLMTSRKERDIQSSLEYYIPETDTGCLERDVVDQDIQLYVRHRLSDDKDLIKWKKDATIREEIEYALMTGAHGMFRWATCQLDTLRRCRNRAKLREALATLPPTLDQTYDRILCGIDADDREYALKILQWLVFSERPLSVEEVAEVIAIDIERDPAFDRDEVLEDPMDVLNICSSLVTITRGKKDEEEEDEESTEQRLVALAHYSVQEYLVSDRIKQGMAKEYGLQEVECHTTITEGCLKYLMQFTYPLTREIVKKSALAQYSAGFWSSHLKKTSDQMEDVSQLAMTLLSKDQPAYLAWIQVCDPDQSWEQPNTEKGIDSVASPLYYAALLGLTTITEMLLDRRVDVNVQGGMFDNPLEAASYQGHEQITRMLLEAGANVNAKGVIYSGALQAASSQGHEQIVRILLEAGAYVNAQSLYSGSTLREASFRGHEQIVRILLEAGVDINARGGGCGSALQAATRIGQEQIVKMLLDAGAEVNLESGDSENALQVASFQGHEQIVRMLLDAGAEVNPKNAEYGSALEAASYTGQEQIIRVLLDAGADVNAKGGGYGSALQEASYKGEEQIVRMLLDAGAEVNAKDEQYGSALQAASASLGSSEQIVRILLDAGAEVNAKGGLYGSALRAASRGRHQKIVDILLAAGAHPLMEEEE